MVDINNSLFSTTDASNNANSPNGYNSSTAPSSVIAIEQAYRGAVKRLWERMGPAITTTGSSNAYVYTPSNNSYPTALVAGDIYTAIANFSNTGAATLAVNGLTATAIKKNSSSGLVALSGTEIQSGAAFVCLYDGTQFELLNPIPAAVAGYLPIAGGSMTGAINFAQASNLASASTTNIGAATGNYLNITGTTTITAFDTVQAGTERVLNFNGILTLTNNNTSLKLPGSANITTAVGDTARMVSLGSGNWICQEYTIASLAPASVKALIGLANSIGANGYYTLPSGLIIQWGTLVTTGTAVTFPLTFPNNCFIVIGSVINNNLIFSPQSVTTAGFTALALQANGSSATGTVYWFAIGN